jgi:hypothetical protein
MRAECGRCRAVLAPDGDARIGSYEAEPVARPRRATG